MAETEEHSGQKTLYYVHDPMCSWCWAFRPTWQKIIECLPTDVTVRLILGGLAADTQEPMPKALQSTIRSTWKTIQDHVPGTAFNFDFWHTCRPRRSTYPACRAVIAAMRQGPEYEASMILAIQQAYYLAASNPSDDRTLVELAVDLGLNEKQFINDLNADATKNALTRQIVLGQRIGARGFPSLILAQHDRCRLLQIDYNDPTPVLRQLNGHG